MGLKIDVFGFEYDDDDRPAFTLLKGNEFYYHIDSGKEYEKNAFDAWLTASGKSFGSKELGTPSAAWQAAHDTVINRSKTGAAASGGGGGTPPPPSGGTGGGSPPPAAPVLAAITAAGALTAAGAPGSPSTSGTVTIGGGPADKAYTLTVTYDVDSAGADKTVTVAIAKSDTANAVAASLAGKAVAELGLTASGNVVTFDVAGGTAATSLDKLTATIA